MKPEFLHDESYLRNRLENHEFAFDEQAWMDMEARLDAVAPNSPQSTVGKAVTDEVLKGRFLPGPASVFAVLLSLSLSVGAGVYLRKEHKQKHSSAPAPLIRPLEKTEHWPLWQDAPSGPLPKSDYLNNGLLREINPAPLMPHRDNPPSRFKPARIRTRKQAELRLYNQPGNESQLAESEATSILEPHTGSGVTVNETTPAEAAPKSVSVENSLAATEESKTTPENTLKTDDNDVQEKAVLHAIAGLETLPTLSSTSVQRLQPDSLTMHRTASAPASRFRRLFFGVGGGMGVTAVSYAPLEPAVSFHGALSALFRLNSNIWILAEASIKLNKQYNLKTDISYVTNAGGITYDYTTPAILVFDFPVCVKLKSRNHERLYWTVGLRPAYVVPQYGAGSSSVTGLFMPTRQIFKNDGFRSFDMGLVFGAEWRFSAKYGMELRYSQGMFDLTADDFFRSDDYHLNSDLQVTFRRYFTYKTNRHAKSYASENLYPAPSSVGRIYGM